MGGCRRVVDVLVLSVADWGRRISGSGTHVLFFSHCFHEFKPFIELQSVVHSVYDSSISSRPIFGVELASTAVARWESRDQPQPLAQMAPKSAGVRIQKSRLGPPTKPLMGIFGRHIATFTPGVVGFCLTR